MNSTSNTTEKNSPLNNRGNHILYGLRLLIEPGFIFREARKTPLDNPGMTDEWHNHDSAGPRNSATLYATGFELLRAALYTNLVYSII